MTLAPECAAAGVEGFPTWVIGGAKLEGEKTFAELEDALARAGARDAVRDALGGAPAAAPALAGR